MVWATPVDFIRNLFLALDAALTPVNGNIDGTDTDKTGRKVCEEQVEIASEEGLRRKFNCAVKYVSSEA